MAAFGGYDEEFLQEVPDRLICHICTKSLREPHLTVCCGQHFCESCLQKWSKKHAEQCCPFCRSTGKDFHHILDKKAKREIESLKVRCKHNQPSNPSEGCRWIGELGGLDSHLNSEDGCGYVKVQCPNECYEEVIGDYEDIEEYDYYNHINYESTYLLRKDLEHHLRNECYLRPYICEHCGFKDTYEVITGIGCDTNGPHYGHYDVCPEFPLTCPNKCGEKNIKRKQLPNHRKKCQLEKVQCPFAKVGCKNTPKRKDEADHLEKSVVHHQLLMLKSQDQVKKEYERKERHLKEAIRGNLQCIMPTCTEQQKFHLESIRSLLKDSYCLKESGNSFVLEMPPFQSQPNVWKSPPFYLCDINIIKLQVKVYATGCGSGAGTHVSFELVSLKRDSDRLHWLHVLDSHPCDMQCTMVISIGAHEWKIGRRPCMCWIYEFEGKNDEQIIDKNEKFITHEQAKKLMHNDKEDDCIILKIQLYRCYREWPCCCVCHSTSPDYSDYSDHDS